MKKLINRPDDVVKQAVLGMQAAHGDILELHEQPLFVTRRRGQSSNKVVLISGGGSGHEPMHAGYVGVGMLDGACPGQIFTSPTPDQIFACTRYVDAGCGVIYLVKNYSGDVMNFEMAAEMANSGGVAIQSVLIADDVAVNTGEHLAGRRGVGATVLAEKIGGALAELQAPVDKVVGVIQRVADNSRSMGMALTSCTVPAVGRPTFELGTDEMEIGIGIHGEPGRKRLRLEPADRIVDMLLEAILADFPATKGDRVLVFVNGMGATPSIELYVVMRRVAEILTERNLVIRRTLIGNYITSLDMAGFSLTLLKLDEELERLWDEPVHTAALRWGA